MKTKINLLLMIFVWIPACAGMTIIYGCGSDTVTGGNGNNNPGYTVGDLIFQLDSLIAEGDTVSATGSGSTSGTDQGYKITYTLSCNTDSAFFSHGYTNNTYDTIYYSKILTGAQANGNFEDIIDKRSWGSMPPRHLIGCTDYGQTAGEKIVLRNYKVYRITYN